MVEERSVCHGTKRIEHAELTHPFLSPPLSNRPSSHTFDTFCTSHTSITSFQLASPIPTRLRTFPSPLLDLAHSLVSSSQPPLLPARYLVFSLPSETSISAVLTCIPSGQRTQRQSCILQRKLSLNPSRWRKRIYHQVCHLPSTFLILLAPESGAMLRVPSWFFAHVAGGRNIRILCVFVATPRIMHVPSRSPYLNVR